MNINELGYAKGGQIVPLCPIEQTPMTPESKYNCTNITTATQHVVLVYMHTHVLVVLVYMHTCISGTSVQAQTCVSGTSVHAC